MDNPENISGPGLPDPSSSVGATDATPAQEPVLPAAAPAPAIAPQMEARAESYLMTPAPTSEDVAARRATFRRNLYVLLGLALAAFILTLWILVRVDSPFGIFTSGPQEVVRAQLRALDLGELKPAYDLFSPRYRAQVSFDAWHELCIAHWQMFHANVVRADQPELRGAGVLLEVYLRGADAVNYRARFTVVRADGRWWIDDVHWAEEPSQRDFWRI